MRRWIVRSAILVFLIMSAGDGWVFAAKCTPWGQGVCRACKNCKYCGHCAKLGGTCSVCRR